MNRNGRLHFGFFFLIYSKYIFQDYGVENTDTPVKLNYYSI